jgi:hypothetical protein
MHRIRLVACFIGMSITSSVLPVSAQGRLPSGFEAPPVVAAPDLIPAALLSGPWFRVESSVPTDGLMGHFTIESTFGTLRPIGRNLVRIRVGEMPALASLEKMNKTQEFMTAAANAAVRPINAAAQMITAPVQTVEALPSALGRFFDRVEQGAEKVAQAAQAPSQSATERSELVASRVGGIAADTFGYEQERRALAKQLGVDPYTTNPILSEKLSDAAWVAFSGRVGVSTLMSVAIPGSIFITGVATTRDLVYDTPAGDLITRNQDRLQNMGGSAPAVAALIRNRWYSLTVLSDLTSGLERLQGVEGRPSVVALAATARSEEEARFITRAVHLLAWRHASGEPLGRVSGRGTVVGWTAGGAIVVPGPVDYVSWTERLARFARRPDLRARERSVVVTGRLTPRTRAELTALGWRIREETGPPAAL